MKRQIRNGVFETNSSSVHSLTMVMKNEFERWVKGEVYYSRWGEDFVTREKIERDYGPFENDEVFNDCRRDEGFYSYDEWDDYKYMPYETFEQGITTPSGDTVIAFGYYG